MKFSFLPLKTTTSVTGVRGTKADTEYRNLGERLRKTPELGPGNQYSIYVSGAILAACVPKSSLASPIPPSVLQPQEALFIVDRWVEGGLTGDQVVQTMFGAPSFVQFADLVGDLRGLEVGAVSEPVAARCRAANPALAKSTTSEPTRYANLDALLERIASSMMTHSALRESPAAQGRLAIPLYQQMATAGFRAVSLAIGLDPASIEWPVRYPEFGVDSARPALIRLHSEPHPLELLPAEYSSFLAALARQRSEKLTKWFGPPTGRYSPVDYEVSLMRSAVSGAMLAAVAEDPSACRCRYDVAATFKRRH